MTNKVRKHIWDWLDENGFSFTDDTNHPCYKCRYWEPWDEEAQSPIGGMVGDCRRFPPFYRAEEEDWQWPETGCMATCGEWKLRKKK